MIIKDVNQNYYIIWKRGFTRLIVLIQTINQIIKYYIFIFLHKNLNLKTEFDKRGSFEKDNQTAINCQNSELQQSIKSSKISNNNNNMNNISESVNENERNSFQLKNYSMRRNSRKV